MPRVSEAEASAPYVDDDDLVAVHQNRSEIVGVLLVPCKSKERGEIRRLVDNRGVLKAPASEIVTASRPRRSG